MRGHGSDGRKLSSRRLTQIDANSPAAVEQTGDAKAADDRPVPKERGWDDRVARVPCLPEAEDGDHQEAKDERGDDLSGTPGLGDTSRNGERDENKQEGSGKLVGRRRGSESTVEQATAAERTDQEEAYNVELRGERAHEALPPPGRDDRVVVREPLSPTPGEDEDGDERKRRCRVDDGPHADAPSPGRRAEDACSDVPAHPGVDDEGQRQQECDKDAVAQAAEVSDDDLCRRVSATVLDSKNWRQPHQEA